MMPLSNTSNRRILWINAKDRVGEFDRLRIITQSLISLGSMELEAETGRKPPGQKHADKWAESLKEIYKNDVDRVSEEYWRSLVPATGRDTLKNWADKLCDCEYK